MWRVLRTDAIAVLKDKKARASLARYFAVMQDDRPAKFMIAKKLPAEFDEKQTLSKLWQTHERLTEKFYRLQDDIDTCETSLDELEKPDKRARLL